MHSDVLFVYKSAIYTFFPEVARRCCWCSSKEPTSVPVAYPEVVSRVVSKSRKFKWLVKAAHAYFPSKTDDRPTDERYPAQSVGFCSPNGWTDCDLFVKWLQHFVSITNVSTDNPQVIILDGHNSHKSLEAITFAVEHAIDLITLPPHCTH